MKSLFSNFVGTVRKLKDMKIFQGHTTLYITPKILHVKLWTEWWETYGSSMMFKLDELVTKDSRSGTYFQYSLNLMEWYCDMFRYAKESPKASDVVKQLLAPGGLLDGDELLKTKLGSDFFLVLSKAEPGHALNFLNRKIGTWDKKQLLEFEEGRRQVVWALERIVMEKEYFHDAAKLLLKLAETENEDFSNNATGIFLSLFSPAPGKIAPTETPPMERLSILEEAMNSESKERRSIAIKACNTGLATRNFSRMIIEDGELRNDLKLWKPKSRTEVIDYYKSIIELLISHITKFEENEKGEVVSVILDNVRTLIIIPEFTEQIITLLKDLHEKFEVDNERIIESIMGVLKYEKDSLTSDVKIELKKVQNELTGSDYHSLMKRYVGMDVQIDWFVDEKSPKEAREDEIQELVKQSLNKEIIGPELEWLVTNKAKHGYVFGYELGKKDEGFSLLSIILDAVKSSTEPNVFFLGGYFIAIYEKDVDRWETELELIAQDSKMYKFLPELTWRSGLTDKAGNRILDLLNKKSLDFTILGFFRYGGVVNRLSENVFGEWIKFLIDQKDEKAIFIALDLLEVYYVHRQTKDLPKELTLKVLLHENIIHKSRQVRYDLMDEYYWKEIGLRFIKQYPNESLVIAEKMLENFGTESIFGSYNSQTDEVLDEITRLKPKEVWAIASKYLGPPIDSRAYSIRGWLRGGLLQSGKNILEKIPLEDIFSWVEEDKEKRASYLAGFIPPDFEIAREILKKYGENKNVRTALIANFSTEGFSGSSVVHYENKRQKLIDMRKKETDPKVKSWLDLYILALEEDIQRSKNSEEREF